jgi:ATP-dependent DNA helicase RecG
MKLILILTGEMNREELQIILDLKDRKNFRESYLKPSLDEGYIEMTNPKNPKGVNQKYRLTEKGEKLKQQLTEKRKEE